MKPAESSRLCWNPGMQESAPPLVPATSQSVETPGGMVHVHTLQGKCSRVIAHGRCVSSTDVYRGVRPVGNPLVCHCSRCGTCQINPRFARNNGHGRKGSPEGTAYNLRHTNCEAPRLGRGSAGSLVRPHMSQYSGTTARTIRLLCQSSVYDCQVHWRNGGTTWQWSDLRRSMRMHPRRSRRPS